MEKKIVLIDSDGVIADLSAQWCQVYNKRYNDTLTPEQFTATWDGMAKVVKPECGEKVYDLMKEPGFFQGCLPYDGAVHTLQEMVEDTRLDCYIVTAYSGNGEAAKGKIDFYEKHCPFFDTERVLLCKPKFLVQGDILIDDSYKNIKKWVLENHNGVGLMVAQGHNEEHEDKAEVNARVANLADAYEYIKAVVLV